MEDILEVRQVFRVASEETHDEVARQQLPPPFPHGTAS